MYKTLASTMYWEGMEKDINTYVKNVPFVKNIKRNIKSTANYHPKNSTMIPWDTVCVDLVGPHTVTDHTGTDRTLMAMTFIDPATGWFEIAKLPNKENSSARISSQLFNIT